MTTHNRTEFMARIAQMYHRLKAFKTDFKDDQLPTEAAMTSILTDACVVVKDAEGFNDHHFSSDIASVDGLLNKALYKAHKGGIFETAPCFAHIEVHKLVDEDQTKTESRINCLWVW